MPTNNINVRVNGLAGHASRSWAIDTPMVGWLAWLNVRHVYKQRLNLPHKHIVMAGEGLE